ncbi:hypothetical protein B0J17DRAFT_773201 [Rhizoctonia solani]|nr:hypothetical protein B0J17DRAFT_773201 [Rhizoctonia solani]
MPKYPFARLPSTALPGSSYYLSNALIVAKRIALGLEDPVRIQSGEWKAGNPLHDWYERNEYTPVRIMQLRKERKNHSSTSISPFNSGDDRLNPDLAPSARAHLGGGDPVTRSGKPHHKGLYAFNGEPIPLRTRLYTLIGAPNVKIKWAQPSMMEESDLDDLREYLSNMIWAHGVRVEQYKLILGCSAKEIQWDVKGAMNDIWRDTFESRLYLLDQKKRENKIKEGTFGNHWSGDEGVQASDTIEQIADLDDSMCNGLAQIN